MRALNALEAGFTGAGTLTLLHELLKQVDADAPRMDLLAMDALSKFIKVPAPRVYNNTSAYDITLLGDVLSNSLYYSLIGLGKEKNALFNGAMLGSLAGIGAVSLPEKLGLEEQYSKRTNRTKIMTIGLYLVGGIMAAFSYKNNMQHKQQKPLKRKKKS